MPPLVLVGSESNWEDWALFEPEAVDAEHQIVVAPGVNLFFGLGCLGAILVGC